MDMNFVSFYVISTLTSALTTSVNDRPIIGILAQKIHASLPGINGTSYINADYVRFVESAGGRVIPIANDISEDELDKVFNFINGVLLPGGDADLSNSGYQRNTEHILKLAIQAFDKGDYFPVWGTCLGLQSLAVAVENSCSVLTKSRGTWDKAMKLDFTRNISNSKMFSQAPKDILETLAGEKVTYNAHYNCVSVDTYYHSKYLQAFFNILSTNQDSNGKSFISTWEAHHYPFYAVQWHPEMNIFTFNVAEGLGTNINHSKQAIQVSQYLANFFVDEARKSNHHFPGKDAEEKRLIYKYTPFHSGLYDWLPEQIYVF